MNKIIKSIIAVMGAVNTIYGMFIPIAVALMVVKFYPLEAFPQAVVIIAGSISSIFKALDVAILKYL